MFLLLSNLDYFGLIYQLKPSDAKLVFGHAMAPFIIDFNWCRGPGPVQQSKQDRIVLNKLRSARWRIGSLKVLEDMCLFFFHFFLAFH